MGINSVAVVGALTQNPVVLTLTTAGEKMMVSSNVNQSSKQKWLYFGSQSFSGSV